MRGKVVLWLLVLFTGGSFGQGAASLQFAVASVRPSRRVAGRDSRGQIVTGVDKVSARNVSLMDLMVEAYRLERYRVSGGPGWLDSDEFDVEAKADGPAGKDRLRLMLQTLLSDRFQLAVHRETKEIRAYALVVDKNGPKIHPRKEGESSTEAGEREFHGDLRQFANLLSIQLSIPAVTDPSKPAMATGSPVPVLDGTGLEGTYDIGVDFRPEPGGDMFTRWQAFLQERLGLKLERRKTGTEFLVIDRAQRTPIEN